MIFSQVLRRLHDIKQEVGVQSTAKKWTRFQELLDMTQGLVLKCFDRSLKLKFGIASKTIENLAVESVDDSLTLDSFINLNHTLMDLKGKESMNQKRQVLRQVYTHVNRSYWYLLDQFYSEGIFKIGLGQKLIHRKLAKNCTSYDYSKVQGLYKMYHNVDADLMVDCCKPMLADVFKGLHWDNHSVELKLDGIRTLLRKKKGVYKAWTRNGTDITTNLMNSLSGSYKAVLDLLPDFLFDGQVWIPSKILGQGFKRLIPLVKSKNYVIRCYYSVFDVLYYNQDLRSQPYVHRRKVLESLHIPHIVKRLHVRSKAHVHRLLHVLKHRNYEGLIIKDNSSTYVHKRSQHWLKLKPLNQTIDVKIVDCFKGKGKYKSYYSSFSIGLKHGDSIVPVGQVGSGFTEQDLVQLMTYNVGRIIQVRAQALTRSKTGNWALRFPRFLRFRDDKSEPNQFEKVKDIYYL